MSDRNALLQQMLTTNTKMLEKYMREGNAEQIAVYQGKVDKLRQQLEGDSGAGMSTPTYSNQPQSFSAPPAGFQPQSAYPPQNQGQPQSQFNSQPAPTQNFSSPAPSFSQPSTPYQQGPPDLSSLDREMQELRTANARLREALAQKEDAISKESRMHALEANEMNARIQELKGKQSSFDALVAEKQAKIDEIVKEAQETERRNTELLNQQSSKSAAALRSKEIEYDEKVALLTRTEEQINTLRAELAAQEQSGASQVRIVTEERDRLQESVDQLRASIRTKQDQIDGIQQALSNIKNKQEEEAKAVGIFVTKSIGAIKLAVESSQAQISAGPLEITAKANVGFANLSITTLVENKTD